MKFNFFTNIYYQVYLLQLENYHLPRFFTLIKKTKGVPPKPLRKTIIFTRKLLAISLLAFFTHLITIFLPLLFFLLSKTNSLFIFLVFLLILYFTLPFFFAFLILACALLLPFDFILKKIIITLAKRKISKYPKLKVIAVAGSYGKTTTKEIIAAVLSEKYQVLKTPDTINTPLGISRLVLEKLNDQYQFFIVEMGEFYRGDIKDICLLTQPDISIVTGINEVHFERLKTIDNTVKTIFEVVENTKQNGTVFLNADNALIRQHFSKYVKERSVFFYSAYNHPLSKFTVKNSKLLDGGRGQIFHLYKNSKLLGKFQIRLLGKYAIGTCICAYLLAQHCSLSLDEIRRGLLNCQPIPHRLEPIITRSNILVIDDSYNGNPEGAKEAISLLGQFPNRKIYLTPGLAELGEKNREIHLEIGKQLAKNVDLVLLIKNSATPYIAEGLTSQDFPKKNLVWYFSTPEAHHSLGSILQPGDVILFQNDWPDNYL